MKIPLLITLSLCLCCISACADRSSGVAVGMGTHGAGVALFSDNVWLGGGSGGSFGGLMVGFGGRDHDNGTGYSSGRIVRVTPPRQSSARPPAWYAGYTFPNLGEAHTPGLN